MMILSHQYLSHQYLYHQYLSHLHIDGVVVHRVVVVKLEMVEAGREIYVGQLPGHPVECFMYMGVFRNTCRGEILAQVKALDLVNKASNI